MTLIWELVNAVNAIKWVICGSPWTVVYFWMAARKQNKSSSWHNMVQPCQVVREVHTRPWEILWHTWQQSWQNTGSTPAKGDVLTQKGSSGPHSFSISVTAEQREPPDSFVSYLQVESFSDRPLFRFLSARKIRSPTVTCHRDRYALCRRLRSLCPPSSVDRQAAGNAPLLPLCRKTDWEVSWGRRRIISTGGCRDGRAGHPFTKPYPLSLSLSLSLSVSLTLTCTHTPWLSSLLLSHITCMWETVICHV